MMISLAGIYYKINVAITAKKNKAKIKHRVVSVMSFNYAH